MAVNHRTDLSDDAHLLDRDLMHFSRQHHWIGFGDSPADITIINCLHLGLQTYFFAHRLFNIYLEIACLLRTIFVSSLWYQ